MHDINRIRIKIIGSSQEMQKKACDKIQHSFMKKTFNKLGIDGIYFNIINAMHGKLTADIILNKWSEQLGKDKK